MLTQLVKQVITSSFNGCYCRVRRFLNSHLTGGQTQVQRNDRHFVRMIFFQTSLEVYQLWTESLQALIQFFNQVIDFSFKIGRFVDSITKVDVDIRPRERGADPLKLVFRPYKRDSTPPRKNGNEKCTLDSKNTSFNSCPSASFATVNMALASHVPGAVRFPIRRMDCHYLSKTMRWSAIVILLRSFPRWGAWIGFAFHTLIHLPVLLLY